MATFSCGYSDGMNQEVHKQGYAVFIVNINKNGDGGGFEFEERKGAREDLSNLQTVFESIGFEWINNKTYWHTSLPIRRWDHRKGYRTERVTGNHTEPVPDQEECCIRCWIQALDHSRSKCFLLVISSHGRELTGKETEIIFSDGQSVHLTEILDALSDKNCPSLRGKPRIIILQACRSNFEDKEKVTKMQDTGVYVNVGQDEDQAVKASGATASSNVSDQQDDLVVDYTFQHAALRNMPDNFMLVYPVVSGQRSQRSENYGSWLIFGLKKMYNKHYVGKPVNFFHLLTLVSGYIARERETIVYKHKEGTNDVILDEQGKPIRDEEKSGWKNAVNSFHRLCEPLIFYPKTKELPKMDEPTHLLGNIDEPNFLGKKSKKGKKTLDQLLSEDK